MSLAIFRHTAVNCVYPGACFRNLSEGLAKASQFLFTGVLSAMADSMAAGKVFRPGMMHMVVMAVEMAAALGIFLVIYKRNGYEK